MDFSHSKASLISKCNWKMRTNITGFLVHFQTFRFKFIFLNFSFIVRRLECQSQFLHFSFKFVIGQPITTFNLSIQFCCISVNLNIHCIYCKVSSLSNQFATMFIQIHPLTWTMSYAIRQFWIKLWQKLMQKNTKLLSLSCVQWLWLMNLNCTWRCVKTH